MALRCPTPPSELLRDRLRKWKRGASVTYLARVLGVSRSVLSRVMNGRTPIRAKLAVRLARAFKTSARWWLRMQAEYDLWHEHRAQRQKGKSSPFAATLHITGQIRVRVSHA